MKPTLVLGVVVMALDVFIGYVRVIAAESSNLLLETTAALVQRQLGALDQKELGRVLLEYLHSQLGSHAAAGCRDYHPGVT